MRMVILGRAFQLPQSTATEYTWALIRLRKYAERLQPTD